MAKEATWDTSTIADFRRAFAELRQHPMWCGYQIAAGLLDYKSARGLRWAAGEYHSDGWPGSNRLAAQLREIFTDVFMWAPPRKHEISACPTCGGAHVLADCHGAPVAAVVALAPGETVKRPGKPDPRPPCIRPRLDLDPRRRLVQLARLTAAAQAELEDA